MEETVNIDESYIIMYIEGRLPDEERRVFEQQMSVSSDLQQTVADLSRLWHLSGLRNEQRNIDTPAAWRIVSRKVARSLFFGKVWNLARTVAAVLLPLWLIYQYVWIPWQERSHPEELVTITAIPGMVVRTTLPDGSQVWLNAGSSLSYPSHFAGRERTVRLTGEAYFKVTSDRKNRFDVLTPGQMKASAYGTEFNVCAHPGDSCYEVTLARGNVDVSAVGSPGMLTLDAGQKALFRPGCGTMSKQPADTYADTAWKDGKMVFRRRHLDHIAEKLSRKFGVTIRLEDDKLKDYVYTATFTDESLEDILDLLKRSAPLTYTISGQRQLGNHTYTRRTVTVKTIHKNKPS